jgi:hypothetical protein
LYVFPGSVRQIHPEYDEALTILLKTDPNAIIVIVTQRIGRDLLPTSHSAIRHDLMHPVQAAATVSKFKYRLEKSLGSLGKKIMK